MLATIANTAKTYCLLTKPRIIMGNLVTAAGGLGLASKGQMDFRLFAAALFGLALVMASSCIFNNYIDQDADKKMVRTQGRALAQGTVSPQKAIFLAFSLGIMGSLFLALFANFLATALALFGLFIYVVPYSFSKYHTVYGTLIGSIAGAVPPLVGYCTASHRLDMAALILFAMLVFWQMPHFYAIALYRMEDYAAASIPVLPLKKGIHATKIQMLVYSIAFMGASCALTLCGYTGNGYLMLATFLSAAWIALCILGFRAQNVTQWARMMFIFSLVVITALSIAIPFSAI